MRGPVLDELAQDYRSMPPISFLLALPPPALHCLKLRLTSSPLSNAPSVKAVFPALLSTFTPQQHLLSCSTDYLSLPASLFPCPRPSHTEDKMYQLHTDSDAGSGVALKSRSRNGDLLACPVHTVKPSERVRWTECWQILRF